jgi:hypothetical protein
MTSPVLAREDIECSAERSRGAAVAIATERATKRFRVGTVLNRNAECDRAIARVGVGGRVTLVIAQEQLAD